jgi:hypothetical protein
MSIRLLRIPALALAVLASWDMVSADPAAAGTVIETFDFNNIGNNSSSSTIQTYMAGVLNSTTGFTAVNGAQPLIAVNGAIAQQGTNSYTGDNHVVGPIKSGTPRPLTLGDTENTTTWDASTPTLNSTDGFLKNCTPIDGTGCSGASSDIFLNFANLKYQGQAVEIASFSFDFEIFPDGSCTADTYSSCGGSKDAYGHRPNTPDLEVWSGDNGTGQNFASYWGVTPSGANGYSVAMPGGETAPQLLGSSGTITVDPSFHLTSLDFMDWPATIGFDNLKVTFRQVPEPTSIGLVALAFGSLLLVMRRNRRRTSEAPSGQKA